MENKTSENLFNSAKKNYQKGNLKLVEKICHEILERDRENSWSLNLLGVIAGLEGQPKEAISYLTQAVKLNPNNPEIHSNLGLALKDNQQLETAIKHYQKALELKPNYAEPYNGLGKIFLELGRLVESQQYYQQALKLDKNHANAHFGLALVLLKQGNFIQGFHKYEWRWQKKDVSFRNFSQPLWDGSSFNGKTLLVYTEQGLGDSIQFIRYIPLVKKLGGRVIVELNQAGLKLLFTTVSGIDELFIKGEKLPDFHWRIPLMSLPRILGTTLETIPAKVPYLSVPKSTDFSILSAPEKNLKVGICWQTSSNTKTSQKRSCPVQYLEGILSIGKANFYILQKEVLPTDLEWLNSQTQIHNLGSSFNDLADTAAAIKQLDLVITIDTVIGHLAGALGKPVWVILNFDSDWRWMLDRNDSPWYPTARLFRQQKIGDWDSLFIEVKQALIQFQESPENLFNSAKKNYQKGNLKLATKICHKILERERENSRTLHLLGVIAGLEGQPKEAISYLTQAVQLNPNNHEVHSNLGLALKDSQQLEAAIKHYQKALELKPNYAEPYNGLGNIFLELGKFEAAIKNYKKALEFKPNYAEPYNGLGNTFLELGRLVESQQYYQQALKLDKNHANAHFGLAVILLKQGNFIQGFSEYEWRWQKKGFRTRNFSQPLWDGSSFHGKSLLVYTEQGLGDSIQFIRYIPLVKKLGGRVIVELNQAGLKLLFTTISGIDELFVIGEKLPDFDLQIPLMSLPRIFQTTLETIPAKIPYLSVPKLTNFPIPPAPEKNLKVGICWQTSSNTKTSQKRSCPVQYLEGILSIGKANFYILQKEVLPADLEWLNSQTQIHNLCSSFNDLADTATVIQKLDLVITIDTVIAHLAGALGKPVWVILNFDSDWRWLTECKDSPWYPTAQLFRQPKIGDWDSVFKQIKESLENLLDNNSPTNKTSEKKGIKLSE